MNTDVESFLPILSKIRELGLIRIIDAKEHTAIVRELGENAFTECISVEELVSALSIEEGSAFVDTFEQPLSHDVYSFLAQYSGGEIMLTSKDGTPTSTFLPSAETRLVVLVGKDYIAKQNGVPTDLRVIAGPTLSR